MGRWVVGNAQRLRKTHERLTYLPLKSVFTQSSNSSRWHLAYAFDRVPKRFREQSLKIFAEHPTWKVCRKPGVLNYTIQQRREFLSHPRGYVSNVRNKMGILVQMHERSSNIRRVRILLGLNFWWNSDWTWPPTTEWYSEWLLRYNLWSWFKHTWLGLKSMHLHMFSS